MRGIILWRWQYDTCRAEAIYSRPVQECAAIPTRKCQQTSIDVGWIERSETRPRAGSEPARRGLERSFGDSEPGTGTAGGSSAGCARRAAARAVSTNAGRQADRGGEQDGRYGEPCAAGRRECMNARTTRLAGCIWRRSGESRFFRVGSRKLDRQVLKINGLVSRCQAMRHVLRFYPTFLSSSTR